MTATLQGLFKVFSETQMPVRLTLDEGLLCLSQLACRTTTALIWIPARAAVS